MRIIDKLRNKDGKLVSFIEFAEEYFTFHGRNIKTNYFEKARKNLQNLQKDDLHDDQNEYLKKLICELPRIIKATAGEIPDIIKEFPIGIFVTNPDFKVKIEDAFNYKAFRNSAKAAWFAEKFDIKACLYCNAQYVMVTGMDGRKKKVRFQFDHFYNKKDYPYLSLTLGNLVPSCSECNKTKSSKNYSIETHIHPYLEDANTKFKFHINENKALKFVMSNRDLKLLKPEIDIIDRKYYKHWEDLHINDIYEKHTDIIEELILKSIYYNESRKNELENEFNGLNITKTDIDRFILGNYSLDSEINKRPLSKLTIDIARQFKII